MEREAECCRREGERERERHGKKKKTEKARDCGGQTQNKMREWERERENVINSGEVIAAHGQVRGR